VFNHPRKGWPEAEASQGLELFELSELFELFEVFEVFEVLELSELFELLELLELSELFCARELASSRKTTIVVLLFDIVENYNLLKLLIY